MTRLQGTRPARAFRSAPAPDIALGVLLVLGAYLLSRALTVPEFGWAAWVSLLPLFLAVRILPPLRALGAGGLWGASLALSLGTSNLPPGISPEAAFALLVAVPALYAGGGASLSRRIGFHPLFLGLGWVAVEVAFVPVGLRHGLLGSALWDGPLVQLLGSVLGYVFVAFLVALVNALLLEALGSIPWNERAARPRPGAGDRMANRAVWTIVPREERFLRTVRSRAPPLARVVVITSS